MLNERVRPCVVVCVSVERRWLGVCVAGVRVNASVFLSSVSVQYRSEEHTSELQSR